MRLKCKKLNYTEYQQLQRDDWAIIIDANNALFIGTVYFVKIMARPSYYIAVEGFRIDSADLCEVIYDRHLTISESEFKQLKVYKLENPNIACKLYNKEEKISSILNYEFFQKYIEL